MPDEVDIAERLRENELQLALAKHKNSSLNKKGSAFCVECDVKMLEARTAAGYTLCIECATDKERMAALFAK
jgi:RNA polymerase-binding transcription factor DksA